MSEEHHDQGPGEESQSHPGGTPDIELSYRAKRSLAMQELLVEKGIIAPDSIQRSIESSQARSPSDGARVVARAWVDPAFKQRLLENALAGIAELGYDFVADTGLVALENTDELHHVVVCTLCSCYPGALLGPPPDWYKSLAYRSRVVIEPRAVLREFGLELESDVGVRVIDSTAEIRYLVLPRRPAGTEGMTEEQLAELVTRNSMIGVGLPLSPELVTT